MYFVILQSTLVNVGTTKGGKMLRATGFLDKRTLSQLYIAFNQVDGYFNTNT